jgi:hypothetical protein
VVPSRPRLEVDQPLLLKTIVDIAVHDAASHEKRNFDIYRSIQTLDELTKELNFKGLYISRNGVYLRLLPKKLCSTEGKRHIKTVPVKLIRAQKDHHICHPDGQFCKTITLHLEEIASLLGPNEVFFKAKTIRQECHLE